MQHARDSKSRICTWVRTQLQTSNFDRERGWPFGPAGSSFISTKNYRVIAFQASVVGRRPWYDQLASIADAWKNSDNAPRRGNSWENSRELPHHSRVLTVDPAGVDNGSKSELSVVFDPAITTSGLLYVLYLFVERWRFQWRTSTLTAMRSCSIVQ